MAYTVTIHDSAKRPWGIETLVTVDDNGEKYGLCIVGKTDKTEIETEAIAKVTALVLARSAKTDIFAEVSSLEEQKAQLEADIAVLQAEKDSLEREK